MSGERRRPELGNTLIKRRLESRRRGRLARTILLGTVAVAFALFWVARELELDTQELMGFLGASAVLVGLMVILGLVGAAAVLIFRRFGR
jgi:hypothetical protein